MSSTYRIIIRGARPGHAPERVARRLAVLFKLDPEQVTAMLAERALIIKRGVELATAARYQASLEKRGCACMIEPEQREAPAATDIIVTSSVTIDHARTNKVFVIVTIGMLALALLAVFAVVRWAGV